MKKSTSKPTTPRPIRTGVKSGGVSLNHNASRKLTIRTGVKSGGVKFNHNQSRA